MNKKQTLHELAIYAQTDHTKQLRPVAQNNRLFSLLVAHQFCLLHNRCAIRMTYSYQSHDSIDHRM